MGGRNGLGVRVRVRDRGSGRGSIWVAGSTWRSFFGVFLTWWSMPSFTLWNHSASMRLAFSGSLLSSSRTFSSMRRSDGLRTDCTNEVPLLRLSW